MGSTTPFSFIYSFFFFLSLSLTHSHTHTHTLSLSIHICICPSTAEIYNNKNSTHSPAIYLTFARDPQRQDRRSWSQAQSGCVHQNEPIVWSYPYPAIPGLEFRLLVGSRWTREAVLVIRQKVWQSPPAMLRLDQLEKERWERMCERDERERWEREWERELKN